MSTKNALNTAWIILLASCQGAGEPPQPSEPQFEETPFLSPGAPTTISLTSSARLGFVSDGLGFRGGHLTHDAKITDGIIQVTPKTFDEGTGTVVHGGPIRIETHAIVRGDTELNVAPLATTKVADHVIDVTRGNIVERITNREDGVEHSWVFQDQPGSGGDMTVEVGVGQQMFVESNDRGLHFKSPQGLGFAYSKAIWRDAKGDAWELSPRWEDNRIRIVVPEEIIASSAYPAILDPTISAELFTDAPAIGTTGFTSFESDVASDGTNYLVVWADQRDDRNFDIFGARVTAAGVVQDTSGIRINAGTSTVHKPRVAFVGTGYVVAWERLVAAGNNDIEAAFVSTAGAVTQLGVVAGTAANELAPAIAGLGNTGLLVWQSGNDLQGAVFNAGAFGAPFAVAATANTEKEPAVAAQPGGNYFVTFTETMGNDNIRGQLVTTAGALSGAALTISAAATAEIQSTVGFDGTNFVVAFQGGGDLRASRVSPAGTLLDATAVVVNASTNGQTLPDIQCTTNSCIVAWDDLRTIATTNHDVFAATLATSGAITVSTNDIAVSSLLRSQGTPHLALAGGNFLAIWDDNRNTDTFDVRGTRLSAAGAILDGTNLVIVRNTSNFGVPTGGPAIVQAGSFTDVLINDSQIPDENIVHVRFTSTGVQSDNPPKTVSNAAGNQIQPAGAPLGSNSLAVWADSRSGGVRNIFASRINLSNGVALDPAGIQVSAGAGDQVVPKVASNNTVALAVWQDRRNGAFDVFGALISSAGTVTVADIPVCTGAGDKTRPNVTFDATNNVFFVVWTDPSGATLDIRGARVSTAGALLDANCGVVISSAAGSQFSPDAACAGGQCLVAWEDRRNDPAAGDIFGSRVTLSGGAINVLDPAGLNIATVAGSSQSAPSVAAAGGYLIAWSDNRNLATSGSDVFGAQVSTSGIVNAAFAIAAAVEDESAPDLAAGTAASSPFSIVYLKKNVALNAMRISFRRITLGSGGGQPCTQNSQCETGFCSDAKCCNEACGGVTTGLLTDCRACSVAHRGDVDGVCTTIAAAKFYPCRPYVNSFCDKSEICDGVSTTCGPDLGQRQGQVCNAVTGTVCPANDATGAPHVCP